EKGLLRAHVSGNSTAWSLVADRRRRRPRHSIRMSQPRDSSGYGTFRNTIAMFDVFDQTVRMRTLGRCLAALISLPTIAVFAATAPTAAAPPTSCPQYEAALQTYAPPGGWDVAQMSAIMARESNCDPTARSAHDSGLLQINDINLAWLTSKMGTVDHTTLSDPTTNIQAAALLCTYWQARGKS